MEGRGGAEWEGGIGNQCDWKVRLEGGEEMEWRVGRAVCGIGC